MSQFEKMAGQLSGHVERLVPGQTARETSGMIGRGSLIFLGGMALAAVSFLAERAIIRSFRPQE